MRSEYLGDCSRFKGLAETLNETHYLLPGMTEDELRQAIVEPAEIKDGHIEEALVERLIENIRGQEDQLPILQHTLLWMWIQEEERQQQERPGGDAAVRLGLADYEQLEAGRRGVRAENVKNALSQHGNRILEGMPPGERRVAEIMFRRMVEVEDHSNRLRRPTQCGTVARLAQVSLEVVQGVADAFRAEDASFIYASRRRVTDDTSIDIMHESLIRQWDTLDRWVRREKASYEVYNDLCRATQRMGEGAGTLLTGLALSRAQHWLYEEQPTRLWARRYGGEFDAAIRFLTASEEAEEGRLRGLNEAEEAARRQEEERLRLQNELEQQALRARLEEQTKLAKERRRFTRLATIAAAVGFVLAAGAAVGFGYWYVEAERARGAGAGRARERASRRRRRASACRSGPRRQGGDRGHRRLVLAPAQVIPRSDRTGHHHRAVGSHAAGREDPCRAGAPADGESRTASAVRHEAATHCSSGRTEMAGCGPRDRQAKARHVASDEFDPGTADPSDLATYTRALAALQQWLDPTVADVAMRKLASGINGLTLQGELSDKQLRAIVERSGSSARVSTRPRSSRRGIDCAGKSRRAHQPIPPAGVLGRWGARSRS